VPQPPTMSSPRILIIGGGIGGLALAQGLKKNGISFTLFEQDLSPTVRAQGYRVRLTEDKGAGALRECLDPELWNLFESTCPAMTQNSARFDAVDGTQLPDFFAGGPLPSKSASPAGVEFKFSPRISDMKAYNVDRSMLRSLLLLGQEENVKFGKSFERYEVTSTGIIAFFKDGTLEEGTLLVGADGIASPIRRQFLPNQRYVDTGCRVIYGKTPITPELEMRLSPELMRGVTVIQDQKPLTLYTEPIRFPKDASLASRGRLTHTEDYVFWVLGGSSEHFAASHDAFQTLSHRAAAVMTFKMTKQWNPAFRAIFELQNTDQTSPLCIISAKPERPDWAPSIRVTLLGDAVHASMPVGGLGANTALQDAASLVKLIVEAGISEKTMQRYIDHMWKDAVSYIEGSVMRPKNLLGFKGFEYAKEVEF
jgi:2-polyprenyl-6-methoxyphenol hydroxylase-like FAD-dependent oxidoreductase